MKLSRRRALFSLLASPILLVLTSIAASVLNDAFGHEHITTGVQKVGDWYGAVTRYEYPAITGIEVTPFATADEALVSAATTARLADPSGSPLQHLGGADRTVTTVGETTSLLPGWVHTDGLAPGQIDPEIGRVRSPFALGRAFGFPFLCTSSTNTELPAPKKKSIVKTHGVLVIGGMPLPARPLPLGLLANLTIYTAVAYGLLSGTKLAATSWRSRRRRKRGLCPKCAYSRTGLTADTPCPECGQPPRT